MNDHEQARELIALEGTVDFSTEQQSWLRAHLRECPACRSYAEATGQLIRALRAEPLPREPGLVRAAQLRVHARAAELRQRRERVWLVTFACLVVTLSAAITMPLLWWGFVVLSQRAGIAGTVFQTGFAVFWTAPVLFASALLMARGTHMTKD